MSKMDLHNLLSLNRMTTSISSISMCIHEINNNFFCFLIIFFVGINSMILNELIMNVRNWMMMMIIV